MSISTVQLMTAIRTVIEECDENNLNQANAIVYAKAAISESMVAEELKVQVVYIISNLQYWRGDTAKETKAILKQWVDEF